jgi:hypothetical protein
MPRSADLADEENVQRRVERPGHLESHWNTAARQRQHYRISPVGFRQLFAELAAGLPAIKESMPFLEHRSAPFSRRMQVVQEPPCGVADDLVEHARLFGREQIEKEGREACHRGDMVVARAEPAAAAAMRENDDAQRALRNSEEAVQASGSIRTSMASFDSTSDMTALRTGSAFSRV